MTEQYRTGISKIKTRLQSETPLLWDANVNRADNKTAPDLQMLFLLEVREAFAAREEFESEANPEKRTKLLEKLADEHNDMLVFLASIIARSHESWSRKPVIKYSVNGDGGYSSLYDRLQDLAPELEGDERALMQVMALLQSADVHLPVPNVAITSLGRTLDKVAANNPRAFMSFNNTGGSEMSPDERNLRFMFIRKATRMIRDHVNDREGERPLKQSDWEHLSSVIEFGYDHPHAALQVLYSFLNNSSGKEVILIPQSLPSKYVPIAR